MLRTIPGGFSTPRHEGSIDPFCCYVLSEKASEEKKQLLEELKKKVVENDALYCLKEEANQRWSTSHNAITSVIERDDRVITLFQRVLQKHEANVKTNSTPEMIEAIEYIIDFKIKQRCIDIGLGIQLSLSSKNSNDPTLVALWKFKHDRSLVSEKMRDDAVIAFRAMKEKQAKNEEEKRKAEMEKYKAIEEKFKDMQKNGW